LVPALEVDCQSQNVVGTADACLITTRCRPWRCCVKCVNAANSVGLGCINYACVVTRVLKQWGFGPLQPEASSHRQPKHILQHLFLYAFAKRMLIYAACPSSLAVAYACV